MKKKIVYAEPADYFPKELRKKYKLGEYADENPEVEIKVATETKDSSMKADDSAELERLLESADDK